MSTNIIEPLEQFAATVLDNLADIVSGPASTLRDGTEHAGVELPRDLYAHRDAIAAVTDRVGAIIAAEGAVTLARLRDELGTSRKYAQALLEHLDATRVTKRLPDDRRVLRRRA